MAIRGLIAVMTLTGAAAIIEPAAVAHASPPGVVIESVRTAADSVRDSIHTLARTTHAFVFGGPAAAEDAWYDNVEATREHARWNAHRVREEAGLAAPYRSYRDDEREYYRDYAPEYLDDRPYRDEQPLPPAVPDGDRY
jgi:hypothetical protein